ncbi:MAG: alpha/beta fold hydrolase [Pseudomonadota bacterium]|nr:alpha/beta fold hydrolase [Pseudomonadota bacterium]
MQTLLWLVVVYAAVCVVAFFVNRMFMYFPDPERIAPAAAGLETAEEVEFASSDGTRLVAWRVKAPAGRPTVLYFHGNAANAATRAYKIKIIAESGYGVFYLNNRGYGGSQGAPSEPANVTDAFAAYEHLKGLGVKPEDIFVYGESLGSGQAVKLAAGKPVAAVGLEAPLQSTVAIGKQTYWFLPLGLILRDRYNNVKNIRDVHVPVVIVHGRHDDVIPLSHGQAIHAAANEPKKFELVEEAGHSDLFNRGAWERVDSFFASHRGSK